MFIGIPESVWGHAGYRFRHPLGLCGAGKIRREVQQGGIHSWWSSKESADDHEVNMCALF